MAERAPGGRAGAVVRGCYVPQAASLTRWRMECNEMFWIGLFGVFIALLTGLFTFA